MALDNHLVCSSLGRVISPARSLPQLTTVVNGEALGFLPVPFGMFTGVLLVQLTFGRSCWQDFMGIDSDECMETQPWLKPNLFGYFKSCMWLTRPFK